jgi:hypothetical protein
MKNRQGLFSAVVLFLIIAATFWYQLFSKRWLKKEVIVWDVSTYYVYLPATFIYKDYSYCFTKNFPAQYVWHTDDCKIIPVKMSAGMAMLYAPFFIVAHLLAQPLGYAPNGYSEIYHLAINICAMTYLIIGLIYLRKWLKQYFSDITVAVSILLITIGTNLWHYAGEETGMSHVYNFTLFILWIYTFEKWLKQPLWKYTLFLGIITGIITLIRPTNVLIIVFFALWQVNSWELLKLRMSFLLQQWYKLLPMVGFALLIWLPQMIYWHYTTGKWFYYSYQQEGFFFTKPNILKGLFGYRKGWLVYNPVMWVSIAGMYFLFIHEKLKSLGIGIVVFMSIFIYITFSWWCWWYGGSYGGRVMIDIYFFCAIPLACVIERIVQNKKVFLQYSGIAIGAFLLFHSIFQTFQYNSSAIHSDSMNKTLYWKQFFKYKPIEGRDTLLTPPNYESAIQGRGE